MFLSSVFNKQFLKYKMFYPAPFRASLKPCTVTKVRQCPRVGPALHLEEEEEEKIRDLSLECCEYQLWKVSCNSY